MEFVGVLRVLARHRLLVALGLTVALLAGLTVAYDVSLSPLDVRSRDTSAITQTARVVVQPPDDPAVDVESKADETLGIRTPLLAELLTTARETAGIAQRAGLSEEELVVLGPSAGAPPLPLALATRAADAARAAPTPYKITLSVSERTGIITLTGGGVDPRRTTGVVEAAIESLRDIVATRTTRGPPLSIEPLGPVVTTQSIQNARRTLGLATVIVLFVLWCGAIVVLAGLRRRRLLLRLSAGPRS